MAKRPWLGLNCELICSVPEYKREGPKRVFFEVNFWACQEQSKTIQKRLRFVPEQKGVMGNRWSVAIFKKVFRGWFISPDNRLCWYDG